MPDPPEGLTVAASLARADVVLSFYRDRAELVEDVAVLAALPKQSALWVLWPRKAAGHVSDLAENDLRDLLLPTGLVDVKVAAVGEDWSGLRFVWRKELRGG
ncbi:DUF3052 family protein [Yinghuangia seranimata]|uniref:DUF3052 family protein n=1 Tax=Yinghuangia seranimata TaxID=408067 RepID=UPI00248B147C|nr:DUF3052 family protein [Yinghuangia seranimata]MDI2125355.1 DUF3052 family protein [Yinghuangia seranimata]